MFERYLVRPSASGASVIAAVAALVLLICGVMLVMPEQPGTSDCCMAVRSVQPQVPISLLAVLPPTLLVALLIAMSRAVFQALDRRLHLPSPRVLCLLC